MGGGPCRWVGCGPSKIAEWMEQDLQHYFPDESMARLLAGWDVFGKPGLSGGRIVAFTFKTLRVAKAGEEIAYNWHWREGVSGPGDQVMYRQAGRWSWFTIAWMSWEVGKDGPAPRTPLSAAWDATLAGRRPVLQRISQDAEARIRTMGIIDWPQEGGWPCGRARDFVAGGKGGKPQHWL